MSPEVSMRTKGMLAGLAVFLVGAALVKRHKQTNDQEGAGISGGTDKLSGDGSEPPPEPQTEGPGGVRG